MWSPSDCFGSITFCESGVSEPRYRIIHGDSRDVLARMRKACIDAVVTDPPYELTSGKKGGSGKASYNERSPAGRARIGTGGGFMGLAWDASGVSFDPEFWRLVYRVLKPGGHLLAFGGTRTWHRIAVAIEDAGFDLRDTCMWVFGSGFPKSLDVSKSIDKHLGAKRSVLTGKKAGSGLHGGTKTTVGNFTSLPENAPDVDGLLPIYAPATPDAQRWEGWGTALKPAHEPILMFRKPLDGTVAENVLKHGTGGLNIDGSRVGAVGGTRSAGEPDYKNQIYGKGMGGVPVVGSAGGRWPANLILGCACENERAHDEDCPVRMLDEQSGKAGGGFGRRGGGGQVYGDSPSFRGDMRSMGFGDFGGASRFFYVAKASRLERELGLLEGVPPLTPPAVEHHGEGSKGLQSPRAGTGRTSGPIRNTHATVKPLLLMRYLIKLVTPPGGIVLDPFLGSGTTAVAAKVEGFSALGIEQDERYVLISRNALKVPLVRRMQKLAEASRREAREARGLKSTPLFDE